MRLCLKKEQLAKILKEIKVVLLDMDGVLIRENYNSEAQLAGVRAKIDEFCDFLKPLGIKCGILSAGLEAKAAKEFEKCNLDYFENVSLNKAGRAQIILCDNNSSFDNLLYIGDDMLDIPVLQKAGVALAPADSRREVKRVADILVRETDPVKIIEFIEALIKAV